MRCGRWRCTALSSTVGCDFQMSHAPFDLSRYVSPNLEVVWASCVSIACCQVEAKKKTDERDFYHNNDNHSSNNWDPKYFLSPNYVLLWRRFIENVVMVRGRKASHKYSIRSLSYSKLHIMHIAYCMFPYSSCKNPSCGSSL